MGFGLPAAIGAKVAQPKKMVVDIDGDASFSMTAMELATASQFGIGVKVLVLNNEFRTSGTFVFQIRPTQLGPDADPLETTKAFVALLYGRSTNHP